MLALVQSIIKVESLPLAIFLVCSAIGCFTAAILGHFNIIGRKATKPQETSKQPAISETVGYVPISEKGTWEAMGDVATKTSVTVFKKPPTD